MLIDSEETSEDVRARAWTIQENEIHQLRDLTSFLDVELNFVQQYLEVLQDVKSGWCDTYVSPLPTLIKIELMIYQLIIVTHQHTPWKGTNPQICALYR